MYQLCKGNNCSQFHGFVDESAFQTQEGLCDSNFAEKDRLPFTGPGGSNEALPSCEQETQKMVMAGTSRQIRQLQTKAYMNLRRINHMLAKYQKELDHHYEYGAQV